MAHIEQAAALARKEGCITDEIFNLVNAVDIALAQGDLQKAETSYTRMHSLQSDFGDFGRSAFFVPRCEAHLQAFRGEWEAALHSLHLCQQDARGRRDAKALEGVSWLEARLLVDVYLLTGAVPAGGWVEAERCLTLGRLTRPRYSCHLGVIRAYQGKLEAAEAALAEARTAADAQHNPQDEAWLLWAAATLAAKQKRWPEALATYEALTDHHARTGRRWEWARVLVERAAVHSARGERGDAERARDLLHESQSMFAAMGAHYYATVIGERLQALAAKV
jgi:tetratricopeptide (TPR) repeat protein